MDRMIEIFDEMSLAASTGTTATEEVISNSMDPTGQNLITDTPREVSQPREIIRIAPSDNYPRRDDKYEERLGTFNNGFLTTCPITPEQLALAGFRFYTPEVVASETEMSDTVRCDYCRGRLQRWEASDDPLQEHHRHYPNCPFLLPLTQGTMNPSWSDYQTRLQSFAEANWDDTHTTPTGECLASAGFHFVGGREMRTHQLPGTNQNNPVYRSDATKCFHCDTTLHSWESEDDVWVEHAKWSNHCGFLIAEKGLDFVNLHNPPRRLTEYGNAEIWPNGEENFSRLMDDDRFQMIPAQIKSRQSGENLFTEITTANLDRPADPLPSSTPANYEQAYQQIVQMLECKVCLNARSSVMFLPCNHIACCPECAKKLPEDRCPVCRADVRHRLDAFIS